MATHTWRIAKNKPHFSKGCFNFFPFSFQFASICTYQSNMLCLSCFPLFLLLLLLVLLLYFLLLFTLWALWSRLCYLKDKIQRVFRQFKPNNPYTDFCLRRSCFWRNFTISKKILGLIILESIWNLRGIVLSSDVACSISVNSANEASAKKFARIDSRSTTVQLMYNTTISFYTPPSKFESFSRSIG